jgi:MoaA/NifB/PqqE/SkfB family radical SAM enzyme
MHVEPNPKKSIAAVFLLPQCDMGCTFCGSELGFDRLRFDEALELFDALERAGYANLVLGGGEPALWRDGNRHLGALAAAAKARGFLVQVNTNGIALPTDSGHGYLNWAGVDRFILPLDGATAASHDALRIVLGRRSTGHFELVERRVAECTERGRELTFGTVLTSGSAEEIEDLVGVLQARLTAGARIHAWHLYRFQAVGRGGRDTASQFAIDPEPYREACRCAKAAGLPFPVYQRDDMLHSSSVEFFWREGGQLQVGSEVWGSVV